MITQFLLSTAFAIGVVSLMILGVTAMFTSAVAKVFSSYPMRRMNRIEAGEWPGGGWYWGKITPGGGSRPTSDWPLIPAAAALIPVRVLSMLRRSDRDGVNRKAEGHCGTSGHSFRSIVCGERPAPSGLEEVLP